MTFDYQQIKWLLIYLLTYMRTYIGYECENHNTLYSAILISTECRQCRFWHVTGM